LALLLFYIQPKKNLYYFLNIDDGKEFETKECKEWSSKIKELLQHFILTERAVYTSALDQPGFRNIPGIGKIHHELVLFEITNGVHTKWILFEKGPEGIFCQVAKDKNNSLKDKDGSQRLFLEPKDTKRFDESAIRVSMKTFFSHYAETNDLHPQYHVFWANCQHFVKAIVEHTDKLLETKGRLTDEMIY
jgi:hypothetical protein